MITQTEDIYKLRDGKHKLKSKQNLFIAVNSKKQFGRNVLELVHWCN